MAQITVVYKDFEEMKEVARVILGLSSGEEKAPETPASQTEPKGVTPQQAAPTLPAQTMTSQPPALSVQQAATAPQSVTPTVPTAATEYTLDDLARAGMALVDSGRQGDLLQLLARFGVSALPALPKAQYGAFATALREMGAQI